MAQSGLSAVVRIGAKGISKRAFHAAEGRCRFESTIFMLAHMRCGSTALANVICGHPEICGYGEAQVVYTGEADLGLLAFKALYNRAWKPDFRFFFDKVLWNYLDAAAGPDFFNARAVFSCRNPRDTIASILNLAEKNDYMRRFDAAKAAEYYERRMERLLQLWDRFPPERRIGITHDRMVSETGPVLAGISTMIGLREPLSNGYAATTPEVKTGVGDPLDAVRYSKIVRKPSAAGRFHEVVDGLPGDQMRRMSALYAEFGGRVQGVVRKAAVH
ncbi:MAG TPA: sulfotransferase [Albidovulum sp.]|uniref:sulfotransferase family protein n=1 Tax=Albidovulum sp. TaxID=1872424 RepID=UPI002BE6021D|nr:sulfotransferase [Albidovulum sp.]